MAMSEQHSDNLKYVPPVNLDERNCYVHKLCVHVSDKYKYRLSAMVRRNPVTDYKVVTL